MRLASITKAVAMNMHIREQVVASMSAKVVGKLCTLGGALALNDVSQTSTGGQASKKRTGKSELASVCAGGVQNVQKLASGRTC